MKLHFGVQDILYGHAHGHSGSANTTTGDVAEILEANYGVMQEFYTLHESEIVQAVTNSLADSMDDYLAGMPLSLDNISDEISGDIKDLFQKAILGKEFDGVIDGVATQASLGGVSHRKKKGRHRNKAVRPSFYDTHLYYSSFKAWIA
jgi:hypothetical protein